MRQLSFLLVCLCLSICWQACNPSSSESESANRLYQRAAAPASTGLDSLTWYRGTLPNVVRAHLLSEPKQLHPIVQGDNNRTLVLQYTHQSLQTQDIETNELVPVLADMVHKSEDGNTYTYELLPDTHWPDGAPLTVADVLFSLKMMVCPYVSNPALAPYLQYVADARPDPQNPRRFTVHMREFFMSNDLFGIYFFILDPRRYDPEDVLGPYSVADMIANGPGVQADSALVAWGEHMSSQEIGTDLQYIQGGSGPYQVEAWEEGEAIRLTRTQNYWGADLAGRFHQQGPDEISFSFLHDVQAREYLLKQQALDVSTTINGESFDRLQESELVREHYVLSAIPDQSVAFVALNNRPVASDRSPLFDSPEVRVALAHAIDLERILSDILKGYGTRSTSPVSPGNPHYEGQTPYPYDPDMARRMLAEAGWEDGDQDGVRERLIDGREVPFRFELLYPPTSKTIQSMADQLQRSFQAIGLDCQLKPMPTREYFPLMREGRYDAAMFSLGRNANPYDFHQIFHSSNYPDGFNFFGYENPQVDSLIESMRIEPNSAKRRQVAEVIQKQLYADQPALFLYYVTKKVAVHKRFSYDGPFADDPYVLLNTLHQFQPDSSSE